MYLSSILFISFLTLGIWISLTSTNWVIIWIGLELNLYSFIPLVLINMTRASKEAATKYFIAQAVGSALLLISYIIPRNLIILNPNYSIKLIIISTRLLIKCGIPPFHYWFPRTMLASSWIICWFLSAPQKLPLLIILSIIPIRIEIFIIVGAVSLMWGGIIINKQSSLRGLIAYSSIGQIGWILLLSQINYILSIFMIFNYIVLISIVIMIRNFVGIELGKIFTSGNNNLNIYILVVQFFHLRGFPPFLGFLLKAWAINNLVSYGLGVIIFIFLLATVINLMFYLKSILYMFWTQTNYKLGFIQVRPNINIIFLSLIRLLSWVALVVIMLPLIVIFI